MKPCPFCGSTEIAVSALFAHCPQCGATGPVKKGGGWPTPDADKREGWNNRATEAPLTLSP